MMRGFALFTLSLFMIFISVATMAPSLIHKNTILYKRKGVDYTGNIMMACTAIFIVSCIGAFLGLYYTFGVP